MKKYGKNLGRIASVGVLSFSILLTNGLAVHAAAATTTKAPTISPWSSKALNEGDKYGIFPLGWYTDGTFLNAITPDKFSTLIEATAKKLDQLGFNKKDASLTIKPEKEITRKFVINSLYKLLDNYDLPVTINMKATDAIEFMSKQGIVKGTNTGLELDKPITEEQAVVMATRMVEFAYDTADAGAKGLFWKVTNGNNTLYLLGSVHEGSTDMYPMSKKVRDAFDASNDLYVEADIINGDMSYYMNNIKYSDGTTLKDHVSAETYTKLQNLLTKMKVPTNAFDQYKPFIINNQLSSLADKTSPEEQAIKSNTGVERYFITKANLTNKPVRELEGLKKQTELFINASDTDQEKDLNNMLDMINFGKGKEDDSKQLEQMMKYWVAGDLEAASKLMNSQSLGSEPISRDKEMSDKLAALLEQEGQHTSFVVVGSAHFVVKDMTLDLLKSKGYNIQFLQ